MKVFISWSGERSKKVAEDLRGWLKKVIQRLNPFMSTEDIRAGARWLTAISGELASTKVGILCLTPGNLKEPWLNFEAGALSKTIDDKTLVCPYLIGLEPTQVPLPLSQFQAKKADEVGTLALVETINSALGAEKLEDAILKDAFETHWPKLMTALNNLPDEAASVLQKRSTEDLLEEILGIVRDLARERTEEVGRAWPPFWLKEPGIWTPFDRLPGGSVATPTMGKLGLQEAYEAFIKNAQEAPRDESQKKGEGGKTP